MKKEIISFWFVLFLLNMSCSQKVTSQKSIEYSRNGKVSYVASKGLLQSFNSQNFGSTTQDAAYFATVSAIENLLYRGVANSPSESPLVKNELESKLAFENKLNDLAFNLGPERFVTKSLIVDDESSSGGHLVTVEVEVDVKALRKYLEENKIIKKFGL
ncbi:hypothetical protein [uncultured Arcticibacterium sp.]|uniref:hypothetical protein n=1 Tax=uncultured Arcticibacterium sp. TaxID=2173042 RepID=UPI0030F96F55